MNFDKEEKLRNEIWEKYRCKGDCEFPYCNSGCAIADEALRDYDKDVHNEKVLENEKYGDFTIEFED